MMNPMTAGKRSAQMMNLKTAGKKRVAPKTLAATRRMKSAPMMNLKTAEKRRAAPETQNPAATRRMKTAPTSLKRRKRNLTAWPAKMPLLPAKCLQTTR